MNNPLSFVLFGASLCVGLAAKSPNYGTLIFEDTFDRQESQELKDEPGNDWTTSSDKTAEGNKEVDLRDGAMYIYTHPVAWHATSVRHEFAFQDGTLGLRFKLDAPDDSLTLNFADPELKTVWAGHLFKVTLSPENVKITDQKTGEMDLKVREERKQGELSESTKASLARKTTTFPHTVPPGQWHEVRVTLRGDELSCVIDDVLVGTFSSPGFAHPTKRLLRLLVAKNAWVDDVKIWRQR